MKNNSKKLFALAAAAALCAPAMAKSDTGFYVAPEIGIVSFSDWCDGVAAGVSCEDSEIGFGIAGGYWFNDLIAAELGARFGSGYERGTVELSYNSFSLGGRVNYPIGTSGLGVTGKAGLHRWSAEAESEGATNKVDDIDFYGGIGANYAVTDNILAQGEYTLYKYGDEFDDSAHAFTGSVVWNF